jgi:nucleoid-associated protein YgaU
MSRENKLALIIGFALILFVGVLVSDHLSSHHREVTRELPTAIDPLRGAEAMPPVLVEYGRAPDTLTTDAAPPAVASTQHSGMQLHVVADSDTISSICRAWYGTPALADSLADYNNLPDPDRLVTGMRLVIPVQAMLTPEPIVAPSTPITELAAAPDPVPAASQGTYTVQPGDTLSEIAQKLMGTSRATVALFEINRSVLPDMDALQVGMQLHYPLPPS